MSTDLTDTIQPNSDQLDAVDLLSGPRTFTITKVVVNKAAEQPVTISLAEFDRPWRPGLSMRRVLVFCWGEKGAEYVGRRIRLYCDPAVVFGGSAVGGTRIEAMSDIKGVQKIPLLVSRGKAATFTVKPLADALAPKPTSRLPELVAALNTLGVTDKADCLAVVSQIADRKLTSANDLTPDELATALDTLAAFNGDGERVRAAFKLPAGGS